MICVDLAPQPPVLGEPEVDYLFPELVPDGAEPYEPDAISGRRKCLNPSCVDGNVTLSFSGRMAVCPACDGAAEYGSVRETRERYYRGRNTALMLALQSAGLIDTDREIGANDLDLRGDWIEAAAI